MFAAYEDHPTIVRKLVDARADLNTKNNLGCAFPGGPSGGRSVGGGPTAPAPSGRATALHIAAANGSTKSAVALLVGGADPTITDAAPPLMHRRPSGRAPNRPESAQANASPMGTR